MSEALSHLMIEKKICRVRVALKATLLASAGLNPMYLAATAILVDIILMIVEYCGRRNSLYCPIAWLIGNILAIISLTAYFFIPDSMIAVYIVMGVVCTELFVEGYQFICERGLEPK